MSLIETWFLTREGTLALLEGRLEGKEKQRKTLRKKAIIRNPTKKYKRRGGAAES